MSVIAQSDLQIWYKFENGDVDAVTKEITNHAPSTGSYITGTANANICPTTSVASIRGSSSIDLTLSDPSTFITLPSIDFSKIDAFTISIWYNMPANNTSNVFKDIVSFFDAANSWNNSIFNEIYYNSQNIRIGINGYLDQSTGVLLTADNTWHHFCITYSGGVATYYFDSNPFYTKATVFTTNTVNNYIGRNPSNSPSDTGITSYIDDFRFYSVALTPIQVASLYSTDDTSSGDSGGSDIICFREGTEITCLDEATQTEKETKVEDMKPGLYVKTYKHGYIKVKHIAFKTLENPSSEERIANRLYCLSPSAYPALKSELYLTGCHSILEDTITDTQAKTMTEYLGKLFSTDEKLRLTAMADERAVPYTKKETCRVWHICLEHFDEEMNYGIYANGLLVESCCERNILKSDYEQV